MRNDELETRDGSIHVLAFLINSVIHHLVDDKRSSEWSNIRRSKLAKLIEKIVSYLSIVGNSFTFFVIKNEISRGIFRLAFADISSNTGPAKVTSSRYASFASQYKRVNGQA